MAPLRGISATKEGQKGRGEEPGVRRASGPRLAGEGGRACLPLGRCHGSATEPAGRAPGRQSEEGREPGQKREQK